MAPRVSRAMSPSARAGAMLVGLLAAGCQGEPSLLCDRVRIVWPYFEIDAGVDVSPEQEGVQMDLTLPTSLIEGAVARLTVTGEDEVPIAHPEEATADENGLLEFHAITVPLGRVLIELAVESECGESESRRRLYVWDGLGFPRCDLDLGVEPVDEAFYAPLRVLRAEHDADQAVDDLQLQVRVEAGRPDMTVTLFALDVATGKLDITDQLSGDDLAAEFDVTLDQGEQALRAVCAWEPAELRPSSVTASLWVDTEVPACELVEPSSRVRAADDLDPDARGVQFELIGRSLATDIEGEPATFSVNRTELAGSAMSADGESVAEGTLILDPPGAPQAFRFDTRDHAGNVCTATANFD